MENRKKYTIVPYEDYKNICDAIRKKTGDFSLIKAKELGPKIRSVKDGEDSIGSTIKYYDWDNNLYQVDGVKSENLELAPYSGHGKTQESEIGKNNRISGAWEDEKGNPIVFPYSPKKQQEKLIASDFGLEYKYLQYYYPDSKSVTGDYNFVWTGAGPSFGRPSVLIFPKFNKTGERMYGIYSTYFRDASWYDTIIFNGNFKIGNSDDSSHNTYFYTFRNSNVKNVIANEGIDFGPDCFSGCTKLESLEFISDIEKNYAGYSQYGDPIIFSDYSFSGCTALKNILLPEHVPSSSCLGVNCFQNCDSLTEMYVPSNYSLKSRVFNSCDKLKKVILERSNVDVPDGFCTSCPSLTEIILYGTTHKIGDNAFHNCISFDENSIDFDNLRYLGAYSFDNTNMGQLDIKNKITNVMQGSFENCQNLQSLNFGRQTFILQKPQLANDPIINQLTVHDKNLKYYDLNNCVINKGDNSVYLGCNSSIIPTNQEIKKIDDFAFYWLPGLSEISIPDNIVTIGSQSFYNCENLTTVTLPSQIDSIGDRAFSNCSSLISIEMPQYAISIDSGCFQSCTSLETIQLPSGITSISSQCFAECSSLKEITIPEGVEVIEASAFSQCSSLEKVVFPSTLKRIESYAFFECSSLKDVVFPEGLEEIGKGAFSNCGLLGVINFPESIQIIREEAFAYSGVTGVINLPNELTVIGNYAFQHTNFSKIYIGNKVNTIGINPFKGCDHLTEILVDEDNVNFGGNGYALVNKNNGTIISGIDGLNIPQDESITTIGQEAFSDLHYCTHLILPANITNIQSRAFCVEGEIYDHASGKTYKGVDIIDQGEGLQTVQLNAFGSHFSTSRNDYSTWLLQRRTQSTLIINNFWYKANTTSALIIPSGIKNTNTLINTSDFKFSTSVTFQAPCYMECFNESWFKGSTTLTSVTIGEGMKEIGADAFYGCTRLSTVNFGPSIKKIGRQAFAKCPSLKTISLQKLQEIEDYAFYQCTSLQSAVLKNIEEQVIHKLGQYAFSGCTSLTKMDIYNDLDIIGNACFYGDNLLNNFTIKHNSSTIKIKELGEGAFSGCKKLLYPGFIEGLESIKENAFYYCTGFSGQIELPSSVKYIGPGAFHGCSNITGTFVVPDQVQTLEGHTFNECSKLEHIVFTENSQLKSMSGAYIIANCPLLKDFTYPASFNSINATYMFYACPSLDRITTLSDINGDICNFSVTHSSHLLVTLDLYSFPSGRGPSLTYIKELYIHNGSIDQSFYNANDLKKVYIGEGVTQISNSSFTNCQNIEEVELSYYGQSDPGRWFYNNPSLKRVVINEGIVPTEAFRKCSNLQEVVFNNFGSITLNVYAFANLPNLKKIYIPQNVKEIQSYCFYYSGLDSVIFENAKETEFTQASFQETPWYNNLKKQQIDGIVYYDDIALQYVGSGSSEDIVIKEGTKIIAGDFLSYPAWNIVTITLPPSVEIVQDQAFSHISTLQTVQISDNKQSSLKIIGSWAFAGCSSLKNIPNFLNLESIEERAFYGCKSLEQAFDSPSLKKIGDYAFYQCEKLESFNLYNGLIYLGECSFCQCSKLEGITIPGTLKKISRQAFYQCQALKALSIEEGVEQIEDWAFASCSSIENIDFPSSIVKISNFQGCTNLQNVDLSKTKLEELPNQAFYQDSSLSKVLLPETLKILGPLAFYQCFSLQEIVLPNSLEVMKNNCFYQTGLRSITLPASLKTLPASAFYQCEQLEEVRFSNLEEIEGYCFWGCIKLQTISLPPALLKIGDYAFEGCNLSSIVIPPNLQELGHKVFESNVNMSSITLPGGISSIGFNPFYNTAYYNNKNNWDGIFFYIGKYLLECDTRNLPLSLQIPDGITLISGGAFDGYRTSPRKVQSIDFNQTKILGYQSFEYCNFENVIISEGIDFMDRLVFYNSTIDNLTIQKCKKEYNNEAFAKSSIKNIQIDSGYLDLRLGGNSNTLEKVVLKKDIEYIADNIFSDYSASDVFVDFYIDVESIEADFNDSCSFIKTLTFGPNVKKIKTYDLQKNYVGYNFKNSLNLQEVCFQCDQLPQLFTQDQVYTKCVFSQHDFLKTLTIQTNIFKNFISYVAYDVSWNFDNIELLNFIGTKIIQESCHFSDLSKLTTVSGTDTIEEIGSKCFQNCTLLTDFPLSHNLKKIGDSVFYNCDSLQRAYLPRKDAQIGSSIYSACDKIVDIVYDNSSEEYQYIIGQYMFQYCQGLKNLQIDEAIVDIQRYAFYQCSKLESIEISNNVTSIGDYAFYNCTSLESATIGNGVTSIGDDAFNGCAVLNNITIGNSVTSIGLWAFHSCTSLKDITIPDSVTSIGGSAFDSCTSLTSITIPDSVTSIGGSAFDSCTSLESVTIGNGVTSMGSWVFYECTSLERVTIGNSVTNIGDYAFYECTSLKDITIPDSVTSIGGSAFDSCTSLESVTVGNGVTNISHEAFYNCQNLKNITLPDSITNIGYSAFYHCDQLESFIWPSNSLEINEGTFAHCGHLENISIPDTLLRINEEAFLECSNLQSIQIPESVVSLAPSVFKGCASLKSVSLPQVLKIQGRDSYLGHLFENCSSLESIEIPDIDDGNGKYSSYTYDIFGECNNLKTVTFKGNFDKNLDRTFYNCYHLQNLKIPDNVVEIGSYTFYNCTQLNNLTLPLELQSLRDHAIHRSTINEINFKCLPYIIEDQALFGSTIQTANFFWSYGTIPGHPWFGNIINSIYDYDFEEEN